MAADFTINTDTPNNPENWFTGSNGVPSYSYTEGTDVLAFDLTNLLSSIGVVDNDLLATTGDVRSVYLALAEALYQAYDGKDGSDDTTSGRLKMTRSRAVDGTNGIRYSTYTIHVQEDVSETVTINTTGVKAE